MPEASSTSEVTVFAPASVANVACGYDVLGFAIDAPGDYVKVRFAEKPSLRITVITGDGGKLPSDPSKNTAGVAALDLLNHLGSPTSESKWRFTSACLLAAALAPRPHLR